MSRNFLILESDETKNIFGCPRIIIIISNMTGKLVNIIIIKYYYHHNHKTHAK